MKIHFTATGNLSGLTGAMRGVNAQAAAMQGTMGRVGGMAQTAINPYNQWTETLNRNKMGMREMGMAVRDQQGILQNHNRLVNTTGTVMYDAAGNAKVMYTQMGSLNGQVVTAGQRFRMFNTVLAAGSASLVKWGKNTQWAGRQLTVGFTVPLMLLGRNAANAAEEYDRAMTRVIKVTDFTAKEGTRALDMQMDSVRDQTRRLTDLGAQWGFMAEETASTMAEFAQMGYIGAQLDQLSDAALRLSFVTGSDLDTSIEATRITAQAFGVELSQLNEEFARLNIVENNTALSVSESMLGLPVVGAVSNAVGMSLQETNGIMAMMKNAGISAKEGATALRTGLLQLVQDATDPTIAAFDKIGLSIEDMKHRMQTIGEGDPLYFFDELQGHIADMEGNQAAMNDMSAALSKLFGVRQTARILSFMEQFGERQDANTAGGKAWKGVMDDTAEVMRVYEFEQRQIEESAAGIADRLRAELNVQMTELGETFLLVANRARELAVDVLRWFNGLDEGVKKTVMAFGAFMGVLGPTLMLAGLFANAMGNLGRIFTAVLPQIEFATIAKVAQAQAFKTLNAVGITQHGVTTANTIAQNKYATSLMATATAANAATKAEAGLSTARGVQGGVTAASATGGIGTGIGKALSGGIFAGGKFLLILKGIAAAVSTIVALFGGWLIAIGAVLALPIFSNPAAFISGFRDSFMGAFEGLMSAVGRLRETFSTLIGTIRNMAGEGSGLQVIAKLFGHIAGYVGRTLVNALTIVVGIINTIVEALSYVLNIITAIVDTAKLFWAVLRGDDDAVAELKERLQGLFTEIAKGFGRMIMEAAATAADALAAAVDLVPMAGGIANKIRESADEMRNLNALQSEHNKGASMAEQHAEDLLKLNEKLGDSIEDNAEYMKDMVNAGILSKEYIKENFSMESEKREVLLEQLKTNENLTDEMRMRVLMLAREIELQESIASIEERRRRAEEEGTLRQASRPGESEQYRLLEEQRKVEHDIANIREWAADQLNLQVDITGELADEIDGLSDGMEDFGDSIDDSEQKLESLFNTFISNIRGEVGNSMNDVATAVTETFEAEKQAAMEAFSRRMNNIKEEFNARSERMKELFSRQKDKLKEQQALMKEQLKERHQLEIKRQDERHEREMDRLEARRQRERDAIEEASDRRIAALQDEQEIDDERERRRQRAFERERARINYLQGMRSSNINMQLALARGELSSAAIMREQMSTDTANFQREGVSRERQWAIEDAKRARDAEIEMIKEVTKARLEAFDERTKAQKKALDEQQKQEQESIRVRHKMQEKALADQQKAQDKALEARHKALEKALKQEQDIAEKRVKAEQDAAERGFDARKKAIDRTLDHWKRTNPQTEEEYRRHLRKLREDLGVSAGRWERIVDQYSTNTTNHIGRGFNDGVARAKQSMGEDARWEQFGRAMMNDLSNGVNTGLTRAFRELAELFGVDLPDSSKQRNTNYPGQRDHRNAPTQGYLSGQYHHSGGQVFGGGGQGIRADEKHAILQSGEYVVQRAAVKAMGVDVLERLNQAHKLKDTQYKYHSGGPVDWQKRTDSKNSMRGQGGVFGRLLSYLADHGGSPGGAQDYGNLAGLPDLVPPDKDATWRFPDAGWRHGLHPTVVQTTAAILNAIPGGQRVTSAFRPGATVAGSGRPSQHGAGLAVDIGALARRDGGSLASEREGDMIAAAFRAHPAVSQVLWKTMTGGNHYNHVHAGFRLHDGGFADEIPDFSDMRVGKGLPRAVAGTMMGHMFNRMAEAMVASPNIQDMPGVDASGPIKQYARALLGQFGWGQGQWPAVHNIVQRESSWNPNAQNPTSTAYGLFQFLNSTWAGVNARKTSDPYAQTRAGYQYIKNRYGTPDRAWDFWKRNHWYHSGGEVKVPQLAKGGYVNYDNVVANLHRNETVLTSDLSSKLEQGINRMAAGDSFGDTIVKIENFHGTEDNIEALATRLERVYEKRDMRRGAKRRMT